MAGLLLISLLAGWLAPLPALAVPRQDSSDLIDEFLGALSAIFRNPYYKKEASTGVVAAEVIHEFGGVEKLKEALEARVGDELADKIIEELQKHPGERIIDHEFVKGPFALYVEAKSDSALGNLAYAWKEALQDGYLARHGLGEGDLVVWFIPSTATGKEGVKALISYLKENGVVVITDSNADSVLKSLKAEYEARYGLNLYHYMEDWYGFTDPEVRTAFEEAVERGEIYNFIPEWPRERQARLDLAIQGFAEDSSLAVKLRDFVRRNWDLVAWVGGVSAKVVFDEYCKRNPPASSEEAQVREGVRKVLDAYNFGLAAFADFRLALDFVCALRAGAGWAGAYSGLTLLLVASEWYVDTHKGPTALCGTVGGHEVCFVVEWKKWWEAWFDPGFNLQEKWAATWFGDASRLHIRVDGREVAAPLIRSESLRYTSLLNAPLAVELGGVRVSCDASAGCAVEVERRESSARTAAQPIGGCFLRKCGYEDVKVYVYSWRVQVDLLGLKEVQAPSRSLKASFTLERGCWVERVCAYGSSSSSGGVSGGSSRPSAFRFRCLPAD
jgi:hypothetical protein